ncbi:hypothetical protein [Streptomyces cadmiisoli]|uniref:hypothetical protein n=1 Tax=Streptomyces cadmiisoli TaxID=2184053 RepID=UPI003663D36B
MTTVLDRYFEIVDSAGGHPADLADLRDILAENVLLMHSGEMVQGRNPAVDLHVAQAAKWARSKHRWTSSVGADGSVTGWWSRSGQDQHGHGCHGEGQVTAAVDADGRISRLHLTLTDGSDRARVLIARHLEVWTMPDPTERAEAMAGIYTEGIRFMEPDDVFVGREVLNEYIDVVRRKASPLRSRVVSHTRNREFILWTWDFGFPGNRTAVGLEVLRLDGDLIDTVTVFGSDRDAESAR